MTIHEKSTYNLEIRKKNVEYFIPQQKIFTGCSRNSGCKPSIPNFQYHEIPQCKIQCSKAKLPRLSVFPIQTSPMTDHWGFMAVKWSTLSPWKKSIKTKKESIVLETYILLKKKSAKWSKYNNLLISNYLLLQPEVSECSNTSISHKNLQVLYRKSILNKAGLARSPLKIKKKTQKQKPTMLKHWNKVFKQTVLWRKLFVISATTKVPQEEGFPCVYRLQRDNNHKHVTICLPWISLLFHCSP